MSQRINDFVSLVMPLLSHPIQERNVYTSVCRKISLRRTNILDSLFTRLTITVNIQLYYNHAIFTQSPEPQRRYLSYRGSSFSIPCQQKAVPCFISHCVSAVSTSQSFLSNTVLIIRRSNCIKTASGTVHSVSDRPVCRLHTGGSLSESTIPDAVLIHFDLLMMSTQCSKHLEGYNKLIIK